MKEAIKISAVIATALLLAACAKKEEVAAPEPAASAPVEAAPTEPVPFETAPVEAAPMGEGSATDATDATATMGDPAVPASEEVVDTERAGGDKVAPRATN